ncbi:MAG TPA: hypothetical protein VGR70_17195 [Stellaceae bacterium]|nr:hypothetical protein [Stellaceae bacterium]
MIGTNRDLCAMREALEYELFRLQALKNLPGRAADATYIDRQIVSLTRERASLSAAIVNRRIEASKTVVEFSRWADGNGALENLYFRGRREASTHWRRTRSDSPIASVSSNRQGPGSTAGRRHMKCFRRGFTVSL